MSRAETEPETETKLEENEEKQVMSMDRKENEKSGGTRDNEVLAGADKIVPTYFAQLSAKFTASQNLNLQKMSTIVFTFKTMIFVDTQLQFLIDFLVLEV